MAVDNSRKKSTPPRPNLPPEGQPWGRWVTDTLNELKLDTGGVKREVISSNKNHNAQLQMSAQQKREIVKVNLKAEEALNIALAASGSTTIYFVAPEIPEQGDIWYENVTGIWFRWVDDQWVPITDETLLEALEAILAQRIANDDKVRTFAQPDAPTGLTAEHVGDLWYDTDDKNKLYRWDGLEWVPIRDAGITEAQDAADAAQGTADDAKTVADDAKETADTTAGVVSQLETQVTADLEAMQGRLVTAEGELTELENVTLPALNSNLGALETALTDLQTDVDNLVIPSVDGLNKITYSTSAPSATAGYKAGDTWFRYIGTGASRVIYGQWHFTGSAWNVVALRNEMIASLDAGKVTTGFLDAGRIAANSITAEKLIIGSASNLIPNGAGEAGAAAGWATSLTWDTSDKPAGEAGSFKFGANSGYQTTNDWWDVEPGKSYRFEVWLKADKPNSRMYIEIRDPAGAHAGAVTTITGEANAGSGGYPVSNQLVPTTWTKYAGIWTPNAGVTRAKIGGVYFNHSNGTERGAVQSIAGMRLKPMTGATLIEDGAVTTTKVAAEAITGNKIKGGSITASDAIFANAAIQAADIASINADTITVGTLSGINISGVTVTGGTITGADINGGTITGETTVTSGGTLLVNGGKIRVQDEDDHLVFETFSWGVSIGNSSTPDVKTELGTFFKNSDPDNPIVELRTRKRIGLGWEWGDSISLGHPVPSAITGAPRRTAGFVASNTTLFGNPPGDPVPGTQIFTDMAVVGDISLSPNRKIRARHIESSGPAGYVTITGGLRVVGGDLSVNGSPIPRMATGSVSTGESPGPGANQAHNISFPPGRFTSPPLIQVTSVNTYGRALVSVDSITTSGARVVTQRVGSGWTAGEIHWFATQN